MRKRIIVEGSDGSGKTTIVNLLAKNYNLLPVQSFKYSTIFQSFDEGFEAWLDEELNKTYLRTPVHDRFFYSEMVYGPVLRSKVAVKPEKLRSVMKALSDEAFLIYCRPPFGTVEENIKKTSQMKGVVGNARSIYNAYDNLMNEIYKAYEQRGAFIPYDYTMLPPGFVMSTVERYLGLRT
jgi:thymidylate kinase